MFFLSIRNWLKRAARSPRPARRPRTASFRPLLEALEGRLAPASHTWIGGDISHTDGDARGHPSNANAPIEWNNSLNWLDGTVPAAGDTAVFTPNTGNFTFTDVDPGGIIDPPITYTGPFNETPLIDANVSVASIQVNSSASGFSLTVPAGVSFTLTGASAWDAGSINVASTGTVTVTVTSGGVLTLSGAGNIVLTGAGTLDNQGQINLSGSGNVVLSGGGTLDNQGQIKQTAAGALVLGGGATLTNEAGAFYRLLSDAGLTATFGSGTFNNRGTLSKDAGTGTSSISTGTTTFSIAFNNSGTINVQTGTVQLGFGDSGVSTGGTFTVAAGATLDLTGGTTIAYQGTYTGSGAGAVLLNPNGTFSLTGDAVLNFPDGLLQWQGTIQPNGHTLTNAASGFMTQSSVGGATLNSGGTLDNRGQIKQTAAGPLAIKGGATLTNEPGAFYRLLSDAGLTASFGSGTFNNRGILSKEAGTGTSFIGTGTTTFTLNFSNAGTVEAQSGTLFFGFGANIAQVSGSTLTGGTWEVFDPATLTLNNGATLTTNNATIVLDGPNPVFTNIANLAVNGGSLSILDGGAFTTAGNFTNNGTLAVDGTSTFIVSGNLTNFSGTTLTGGTYLISGTFQFSDAAITTDAATIVLDGASAQIVDQNANNALGNLAAIAAAGRLTVQNGQAFTTAGDFSVLGTLTVGADGTFGVSGNLSVGSGATLTVQTGGALSTTAEFNNLGTVVIGAGVTVNVGGNYTQDAAASLDIQLGGTGAGQFGQLAVTGTATLNGTLTDTLVNGYVPVSGDAIQILTFAARSGDFTTGPAGFSRNYDDVGGTLTLVQQ